MKFDCVLIVCVVFKVLDGCKVTFHNCNMNSHLLVIKT